MVNRLARLTKSSSYFLLGPRGAGKSTLIKAQMPKNSLYIDLLNPEMEDRLRLNPDTLRQQVLAAPGTKWVVLDEVQKLPRLLDTVQLLIENHKTKFILSGSSARKLKRGGANLLAGRAFVFHLYPFSVFELYGRELLAPTSTSNGLAAAGLISVGLTSGQLNSILRWGLLPRVQNLKTINDKIEYLKAYTTTYLKEEIQMEQIVRNLGPFRQFLNLAAQSNAQVVNFTKIARDIGVDTTTVQNYYSILEDTLVGFYLQPYHRSVRKRQRQSPKFYLFDTGVCRALNQLLDVPVRPRTYDYGQVFEHFIVLEFIKLAEYYRKPWQFYYLRTQSGLEIDLIVDKGRNQHLGIEIKSATRVTKGDVQSLNTLGKDLKHFKLYCLSQDTQAKKINNVNCLHWAQGLKKIFNI